MGYQDVNSTVFIDNTDISASFTGPINARQGSTTVLAAVGSRIVKSSAGTIGAVSVIVSGTTVGYLHDTQAPASASASNMVAVVPAALGIYSVNMPLASGIVFIAGTGMTASISYE